MKLLVHEGKTLLFLGNKILTAVDTPKFGFNYSFLLVNDKGEVTAKSREDTLPLTVSDVTEVIAFYEESITNSRLVYLMECSTTANTYLTTTDNEVLSYMENHLVGLATDTDKLHRLVQKRNEARGNLFRLNKKSENLASLIGQ